MRGLWYQKGGVCGRGLVVEGGNREQLGSRGSGDRGAGQPASRQDVGLQGWAHSTGKPHEGSRGRRGQQVSEPHRRARTAVCSEPCSSGTATSWPASPWNWAYNDCYVEDDDNNNSNNDDDNRNNYGDDDDDYTAASSLLRIWLVRMMTGVADSSTASLSCNHHDEWDVMTKKDNVGAHEQIMMST